MRLIDADEIPYLYPMDEEGNEGDGMTLQSTIDEVPTIEAIPIPKGVTNGEMLKAMFCDARIWQSDSYHMAVEFKDALCIKLFEIKWWNAPYKENINE